jgi:hypothetical protein
MKPTGPVGPAAETANAALQPLAFLIGEWRTRGTHPMVPGETLAGRTSFAWHKSGAFVIMRSEVDAPDFPDGVAIIGSDNDGARFSMLYFDERGVSRVMDVTVAQDAVTWRHDDPEFAQCLTITKEGERLVSKGMMSQNGGPWTDDLSQVFER